MKKKLLLIIFFFGILSVKSQTEQQTREIFLASTLCSHGYTNWVQEEPVIEFEKTIMKYLGFEYTHP